jgi:hypothetical protein
MIMINNLKKILINHKINQNKQTLTNYNKILKSLINFYQNNKFKQMIINNL